MDAKTGKYVEQTRDESRGADVTKGSTPESSSSPNEDYSISGRDWVQHFFDGIVQGSRSCLNDSIQAEMPSVYCRSGNITL